jgi:hypothetical protein
MLLSDFCVSVVKLTTATGDWMTRCSRLVPWWITFHQAEYAIFMETHAALDPWG